MDASRTPSSPRRRLLLAALGAACAPGAAAAAAPSFSITIGANPGGGYDQVGRGIGKALLACGAAGAVTYQNRGGAGGTLALAQFASASRGAEHSLLVVGAVMAGAIAHSRPPVTLANTTPIASLIAEHNAVVVPAASPIADMRDLMARLRRHPDGIKWGGGSKGSVDQIVVAMLGRAAGVSASALNYVPFKGGGEAAAAVLGGFVDVVTSGISELEEFIASRHLRALAVTAPQRLAGLDVPTLREQGIAMDLANWRGLCAGPGLGAEAQGRLIRDVERATATEAWRELVARNHWSAQVVSGDAFGRFIDAEQRRLHDLMAGLGLI